MEQQFSDRTLNKYSNKWTLLFKNPEDEHEFGHAVVRNMRAPLLVRMGTYFAIITTVGYRVAAILSGLLGSNFIVHTTVMKETFLLVAILLALVIELLLRITHRLETMQGFFIYTTLPVVVATAAFYTQEAPYFGAA